MVFSQLIFSLFCVLDTLIPALATYCICACSEHAHQWLWRGPPGNHSHHSLGTAFSSNRKSTQRQEPPLICRHWWGPPGSRSTYGQLRREHGNNSALIQQGSAARLCTCPLCNIYQQPSFILLFPAFHFKAK